jgi:hypothetical protein
VYLYRMIRPMVEEGWRPVTLQDPIDFAPHSINQLIVSCCDASPLKRPNFQQIIETLDKETQEEIREKNYFRQGSGRERSLAHVRKSRKSPSNLAEDDIEEVANQQVREMLS